MAEEPKWKLLFLLSLLALGLYLAAPLHGQSLKVYQITEQELTQLETALSQAQEELKKSQSELEILKPQTLQLVDDLARLKNSWKEYEAEVTVQRITLISALMVVTGLFVWRVATEK